MLGVGGIILGRKFRVVPSCPKRLLSRSTPRLKDESSSSWSIFDRSDSANLPKSKEWTGRPFGVKVPPPRAPVPERPSDSESSHPTLPTDEFSPVSSSELESNHAVMEPSTPKQRRLKTASFTSEQPLISTSHMTGIIQRISYHLLFRPQTAKASGKLPIQIALLAPTHAINSLACVLHSVVQTHSPTELLKPEGPPRTVLILVPTEAYKFQAMQMVSAAQIPSHRSWTVLTEDELWCSLFPGYSNLMTPYIDATGCVLLPRGAAAQKFTSATQVSNSAHTTLAWAHGLEQNAEAHRVKAGAMGGSNNYCRYSARELLWAILRPQTSFDESRRSARLEHAIHALKAAHITDIIPFNTSMETLSALATIHGITGQLSIDFTLPNFLSSFHSDIPAASSKPPKRDDWMPNVSFALDFAEYSNVQIPYLSLANSNFQSPEWVEKSLEHMEKSSTQARTTNFTFVDGVKASNPLLSRAFQIDPFPLFNATSKSSYRYQLLKSTPRETIDDLMSPTSHLELSKDNIGEVVPLLLSLASHAAKLRDTPSFPLRILFSNNLDLVAGMNMLEMQGIPTLSQSLFATAPVRMICNLFTILIDLSKQCVLTEARELEELQKTLQTDLQHDPVSTPNQENGSTPPAKSPTKRATAPKSELHWKEDPKQQVNLAAAFHAVLHDGYGFDIPSARRVESRLMFQFIKYKDPMMSLLLGIATEANYMHLDPNQARRKVNRHSTRDLVAEERKKMMSREFDASIDLATEDATMMVDLLKSPRTPFRMKSLASEILRLQQALAQQEKQLRDTQSATGASTPSGESGAPPPVLPKSNLSVGSLSSNRTILEEMSAKRAAHKRRRAKLPSHGAQRGGTGELSAEEIFESVYSANLDSKAVAGAKHLYQDLAYLIGAIRAMPLSPSEIIDLFIARHIHRAHAPGQPDQQQHGSSAMSSTPSSNSSPSHDNEARNEEALRPSYLSEEALVLIRDFSRSLKGLQNDVSFPQSVPRAGKLTEHYASNIRYLQNALHFVKHSFVEIPMEAYDLATQRAQQSSLRQNPARAPSSAPVFLHLDNHACGSGDFQITLRILNEPTFAPQPSLLPPPPSFTAQLALYGSGERLSAERSANVEDSILRNDFDALRLRRQISTTLLYAFTSSRFAAPPNDTFNVPFRESYNLKTFTDRLESYLPHIPKPRSLAFEAHRVNNPTPEEISHYFQLPEGITPSRPKIGSANIKPDQQSPTNAQLHTRPHQASSSNPPLKKKHLLDYTHPVMDIPRNSLVAPLSMNGPSFLFFGSHRPFEIGSSTIRVFRECQVLFALRYVFSVEPGKPASIHATTGMALHEAASKVHSQVLEQLSAALKISQDDSTNIPSESGLATLPTSTHDHEATELEVHVSEEDTRLVHETLIEEAFKASIMQSQGLTEEEARTLMSKPEYREHVERAKTQTLWQWKKEKEKQKTIGEKHKKKKEKERIERKTLDRTTAATLAETSGEAHKLADAAAKRITQGQSEALGDIDSPVVEIEQRTPSPSVSGMETLTTSSDTTITVDVSAPAPGTIPPEIAEDNEVVDEPKWSTLPGLHVIPEVEDDDFSSLYSFSEQEFSFKLPTGHEWKGAWDRIDIDPETGGVEITEYKTSLKRNRETGLFQLQTYALAYWKVHHVLPSKLVLASLADTKSIEYTPSKLDLIRTENLILATLQRMADGTYSPTNRPSLCISCHYNLQCPSALTASPLFLNPPPRPSSDSKYPSPVSNYVLEQTDKHTDEKDSLKSERENSSHPHTASRLGHSSVLRHGKKKASPRTQNHKNPASFHVTRSANHTQL